MTPDQLRQINQERVAKKIWLLQHLQELELIRDQQTKKIPFITTDKPNVITILAKVREAFISEGIKPPLILTFYDSDHGKPFIDAARHLANYAMQTGDFPTLRIVNGLPYREMLMDGFLIRIPIEARAYAHPTTIKREN